MNESQPLRPIQAFIKAGNLLHRRLWLLLLPIGLDIVIWFSPRVAPGTGLLVFTDGLSAEEQGLLSFVQQWNILSAVLGLWVPSLGVAVTGDGSGTIVEVESLGQLSLILAVLLAVSLVYGSAFLALNAAAVQETALTWDLFALRVMRLARRLAGLAAIIVALIFVPLIITSVASALIPPLGLLLSFVLLALLFWIGFHAFFIVSSVALARQGLLRVIRLSLRLVHGNLWSFAAFFLIYWVMILLTGLLWNGLLELQILGIGRMLAIVGNAYIGTRMTLTAFFYIWSRILIFRGESSPAQT